MHIKYIIDSLPKIKNPCEAVDFYSNGAFLFRKYINSEAVNILPNKSYDEQIKSYILDYIKTNNINVDLVEVYQLRIDGGKIFEIKLQEF